MANQLSKDNAFRLNKWLIEHKERASNDTTSSLAEWSKTDLGFTVTGSNVQSARASLVRLGELDLPHEGNPNFGHARLQSSIAARLDALESIAHHKEEVGHYEETHDAPLWIDHWEEICAVKAAVEAVNGRLDELEARLDKLAATRFYGATHQK